MSSRGARRKLLTALTVVVLVGLCLSLGRSPAEQPAAELQKAAIGGPAAHLALAPGQPPGVHFRGRSIRLCSAVTMGN